MSIFNNVDKSIDLSSLMRMDLPLSSKPLPMDAQLNSSKMLPMDPQLNSSKTFPKRKALEKFGVSSSIVAPNNSSLNVSAVSNGKLVRLVKLG
jgi:hypothetical protein